MEIDFLGLKSHKYSVEQDGSKDAFTDTGNGGVETSLSLSTSSSLDHCHREILNFSEKKTEALEFPCDKMIPSGSDSLARYSHGNPSKRTKTEQPNPVMLPRPVTATTTAFPYDLNDNPSRLSAFDDPLPEIVHSFSTILSDSYDKAKYAAAGISGDAGICTRGYTPTVAMARRATLARFLEKRLHRMNQARTSHLMGKSLNAVNIEVCNTTLPKSTRREATTLTDYNVHFQAMKGRQEQLPAMSLQHIATNENNSA